jgi:hypothetical protein
MYKSNYSKEHNERLNKLKLETSEEFLARGGKIDCVSGRQSFGSRSKSIDAQALLDKVIGTKYEAEVIKLLRSQGIQVEGL